MKDTFIRCGGEESIYDIYSRVIKEHSDHFRNYEFDGGNYLHHERDDISVEIHLPCFGAMNPDTDAHIHLVTSDYSGLKLNAPASGLVKQLQIINSIDGKLEEQEHFGPIRITGTKFDRRTFLERDRAGYPYDNDLLEFAVSYKAEFEYEEDLIRLADIFDSV